MCLAGAGAMVCILLPPLDHAARGRVKVRVKLSLAQSVWSAELYLAAG